MDENKNAVFFMDNPFYFEIAIEGSQNYETTHWHDKIEIIYCLDNEISVVSGNQKYILKEDDFALINPYEMHFASQDAPAVCLIFRFSFDQSVSPLFDASHHFHVVSNEKGVNVDNIRSLLHQAITFISDNKKDKEILFQAWLIKLYYELVTNFQSQNSLAFDSSSKIEEILNYIRDHYQEDLSLEGMAEHFSFSPSYFSRLISKTIGKSFKDFLDEQRFVHANSLLNTTDKSIEEICEECGFKNVRRYVQMHKDYFHVLPSDVRKKGKEEARQIIKRNSVYQDVKSVSYLGRLLEKISNSGFEDDKKKGSTIYKSCYFEVDYNQVEKSLRHTFLFSTSIGRASDILKRENQIMLEDLQANVGYHYIKFHGLFDDELSVYSVDLSGKEIFNFTNLDRIFDYLLSIHLKPIIQLSFMPKELAKYKNKTLFHNPLIMSEPNDMDKWCRLVEKFTLHILYKYGRKEVESWPFTLWNEPETNEYLFGFQDKYLFVNFYTQTFDTIKKIDANIAFGFPSFVASTIVSSNYFDNFIKDISPRIPDFIPLNFYPMKEVGVIFRNALELNSAIHINNDPNYMQKIIQELHVKQVQIHSITGKDIPIYITEWNSTTSHRDLVNDTVFKAAYITKNIIDNYDEVESFGYWSMSDSINELAEADNLFHGGHGLYTRNGLRKPGFYAMMFLAKLKDQLLYKNSHLILTKDEGEIVGVVHNYINYNELYANGQLGSLKDKNRYLAFEAEDMKHVDLSIDHIPDGDYIIEEFFVNKTHGSVFDLWLRAFNGSEPYSKESIDYLVHRCTNGYRMRKVLVKGSQFTYSVTLEPHEVRLFKIIRQF